MAYGKGLNPGLRKFLMEKRRMKMMKEKNGKGKGNGKNKPAIPKKKAPKM